MILDIYFLHSRYPNCGCDGNASTGPTMLEFIFASQEGIHLQSRLPPPADPPFFPMQTTLRFSCGKSIYPNDAAVLTDMPAKLRRAGIFALEDLQGLSLDQLKEAVAVLSLNAVQLRRLFTAVTQPSYTSPSTSASLPHAHISHSTRSSTWPRPRHRMHLLPAQLSAANLPRRVARAFERSSLEGRRAATFCSSVRWLKHFQRPS
jgi:hypothetical protein